MHGTCPKTFSQQVTKLRFEPVSLAPEPGFLNMARYAVLVFCFPNRLEAYWKPRTKILLLLYLYGVKQRKGTEQTFIGHFLINLWNKNDSHRIKTKNHPVHLKCQTIIKCFLVRSWKASHYSNSSQKQKEMQVNIEMISCFFREVWWPFLYNEQQMWSISLDVVLTILNLLCRFYFSQLMKT